MPNLHPKRLCDLRFISATRRLFPLIACIILLFWVTGFAGQLEPGLEKYTYRIVNRFPHDPLAFTQGLEWDQGAVYEGTGKLGHSSLRRVDLKTGAVERRIEYPDDIFGEGITVFLDKIYQLTWKNRILFVYNKDDFSLIEKVSYPRQGWGLTHDHRNLIASDGSSTLYFLDPETLVERKRITVQDNGLKIQYLNELEYINGRIFANIFRSDRIAMINPENGAVEGWIDLSGLREELGLGNPEAVLNGIMFDKEGDRLFITGKFWPTLFEIRLIPVP
jgi:glutaminyl-peptide cyclotransferase